jgi:catechol 2,3-dioxygenase-like lactoylglutathione lyase family enzyme
MDATDRGLGALTLFVENLAEVRAFYRDVLQLRQVFEDDVSAVFDLAGTLLNVLALSAATPLVAPARPAAVGSDPRMLLSLWVDDVDAACAQLRERGVRLLNGPIDRAWGKRTASFVDPSGAVWEVAQDIPSGAV